MDSITHLALGACMGESFASKKLGKKAMLWGALAQSIPDIDFVASFWMDTPSSLLAHRGFTHSFLFCGIVTVLFALIAEKLHRPHNIKLQRWMLFFGGVIFIHIFIDAFNNYGVGWFEPFSQKRISFNAIYVVDPFFSIWPIIAICAIAYSRKKAKKRLFWWRFGLGMCTLYLIYCLANKAIINSEVKEILNNQKITYTRYFSTPASLQNWLWYVVAGDNKGYHVGYISIFDSKKQIDFKYFPTQDSLLEPVKDKVGLDKLKKFSQEFYTIEYYHDTLVLNDLRFGQVMGWQNPDANFVFHYYLQYPDNNAMVVQRGRFEGWNLQNIESLIKRIQGN